MEKTIVRRLQCVANDLETVFLGKKYTSAQMINEVLGKTEVGEKFTTEWERILNDTTKERAKIRSRYRISCNMDRVPYHPYYTERRFLYLFWVYNIGCFEDEAGAEGFLKSCIDGYIFEKYFKWRRIERRR